MPAEDLDRLLTHVDACLGPPATWRRWPGGWQNDIESALIDAVLSARAVYKTKRCKGIYYQVTAWQQERSARRTRYTLTSLVEEIRGRGVGAWCDEIGNTQRSPSRPATAPWGPTKAAAVLEAAEHLLALKPPIDSAADVNGSNLDVIRSALRQVDGIGYATANYFTMLLGYPGVKPDRMIHRFLRDALGHDLNDTQAARLVRAAAEHLNQTEQVLDHAIWNFESERAASARWRFRPPEKLYGSCTEVVRMESRTTLLSCRGSSPVLGVRERPEALRAHGSSPGEVVGKL